MSKYVTAKEQMFQCKDCGLECASRELKHKMKYTLCPRCDSIVHIILADIFPDNIDDWKVICPST